MKEVSNCCKFKMIPPDWEMADKMGSLARAYACYICEKCGNPCEPVKIDLEKSKEHEPKIHELKIKQEFAAAYYNGLKPWEIRKNDRDFKAGDKINFTILESGHKYQREIIYLFESPDFGLLPGYCILTLSGYKYSL